MKRHCQVHVYTNIKNNTAEMTSTVQTNQLEGPSENQVIES